MPPKKRNAAGSKKNFTAAAAKKTACNTPTSTKCAGRRPRLSPASRVATDASAAKTKAPVRTSSNNSSRRISASPQQAACPPGHGSTVVKITTPSPEGCKLSSSPQPPVTAQATAARTPAPATRAHRKSSTVKQPPRTDEELDDGDGVPSSATEEKMGRTCRTDAHANTTVTIASLPIVVPGIDEKASKHEGDDGKDVLLFRSGVFDAPSLPPPSPPPPQPCTSLVASAAVTVKQNLVTSPEATLSHPPRLLHDRADGRGRSSSATLDLRSCTTPPPPLLQPNVGGAGTQPSFGSTHNTDSLRRSSTENSPEALMANSESKPSSHRWQLQLLGGGTPATQRLPEGDAFREDSGRHGDSPNAHTAETVKQLFTETARSITITSTSADDSPNSTLIMSCGSDEDDVEEAGPAQPHGRQSQHHERLSPPLNTRSITTRSESEGRRSVGKAACEPTLPPVSATAATPPPLPSLVPRVSSTGGVQLFRGYSSHGSGGVTDNLCCGTSTWLLSTQPSAPKEDEAPLSLQSKAVAAVAESLPALRGRLRMGGNTSRQSSPSSSYVRLKRASGGDVVEASHHTAPTPSASSAPLPAHPPCQHQQWLSYASSHLSFTSSSPSHLSRLADMDVVMEANAEAEGGHASITTTPQKRLLREPPVWRSPQITQLPKSLSVSPVSLRGGSRTGVVKSGAALSLSQPLLHTQHAAHSASPAHSSTGEATQTFTQACANAAGDSEAPVHVALSGPTAAPAVGRPSTQLITKAAATRPIASPGTMWIFLDDDDYTIDDSDSEDKGCVVEATTAASPPNSSDAPLSTVKMETDADADAVYTPPALTAVAAVPPSPSRSPEKGVLAMGDKQEEAPVRLRSRGPSLSKADRTDAGILVSHSSIPVLSAAQARRRLPADKNHPIAEILSPTFRPRRRPPDMSADPLQSLGTGGSIHQRLSSWPASQCYITLDDDTDDEDADEAPPRQRARNSPVLLHASPVACVDMYSHLSLPLIIDDDDDDIALEGGGETHTKESREEEGRREGLSSKPPENKRVSRVARASEVAVNEEHSDDLLKSLQKPNVKDFIFPNRLDPELRPSSPLYRSIHAYQQHYQQQLAQGKETEEHDARHVATLALPQQEGVKADCRCLPQRAAIPVVAGDTRGVSAANDTVVGQAGHKRSRTTDTKRGAAASAPALPDWGRPADMLLRDFFPTKFTKKSFMEAAKNVMSPMHFLEAGDFWAAFASAEFVGEGSFGLVWRCLTVDGDLVAVKSCPIILRTKANIEDSFSTIREIATMRFLNEMQVPYVLPLHSAFFVHAQEALPPLAQEALEWRQKLRKRAEEAALEVQVNLLARGGHRRASNTGADDHVEGTPLTLEQQVAVHLERLIAAEGSEEQATRARLQSVRLPRFLSITHDDLAQSDATVFLVMELCDGDVEGICRSDGIAKGMVYCVSSALAAMHELGLLHLDLKPSNILFAYEHGPSQQRLQRSSATGPTTGAVKFYLSDFGNCRLVGPNPMDEVRDAYGTFEYMDLRALRDAVCGRPTDAFSLGATLYELLYGRRLYPKCVNPRCIGDEDHSRECFVEAASQPVVLPTVGTATAAAMVTLATTDNLNAAADEHTRGPCAKGVTGSSSNMLGSGPALTPLQYLALALLQQPWAERMTAEECRRYLVQAFQITQTGDSSP